MPLNWAGDSGAMRSCVVMRVRDGEEDVDSSSSECFVARAPDGYGGSAGGRYRLFSPA